MKKLAVLIVCAAVMASCDSFSGGSKNQLKAENDSLLMELTQRNAELDEMMGTFNDISEGFRQINAAESRVDLQRGAVAEGSLNAKQQIASDIEFIRKQMEENKEQIAKLQSMLKNSKNNSAQLKRAVESLTQELVAKTQRIEELQAELASKNIRIQELDAAVTGLSTEKEELTAENEAKAQTVAEQDKALNTAWFVFGTKKELKDQKILTNTGLFKKGQVLKDSDINKDYFTQVDIRTTKEIKLYSKDADILTTHPAGSYALEKDDKGQLTLKITNPKDFWSVSKYLVIQVKYHCYRLIQNGRRLLELIICVYFYISLSFKLWHPNIRTYFLTWTIRFGHFPLMHAIHSKRCITSMIMTVSFVLSSISIRFISIVM